MDRPVELVTALVIAAIVLAAASASGAGPGVLFHAELDRSVDAARLAGAGRPIGIVASPEYAAGRSGKALACGPEKATIVYAARLNLLLACGTVAFWPKPQKWTPFDGNFDVFFEAGSQASCSR